MKDYIKMSDFELNSAVAQLSLWKKKDCEEIHGDEKRGVVSWADGANWHVFDPCNNPSDAWPIIHGNDIMLNPNCADELWKAEQGFREKPSGFYDVATAYNKNPLRAAMIVFLMMKDKDK